MIQGIEIGDLVINSKTDIGDLTGSRVYSGQDTDRFFWLDGEYCIEKLVGEYRIGLYFKDRFINTAEIYSMDFENEDQIREMVLKRIKDNYNLDEKSISYQYDKRSGFGSVLIKF